MKACLFPRCNRKYKRDEKLVAHVEKEHPFCTLRQHLHTSLKEDDIHQLIQQMEQYITLLYSDLDKEQDAFKRSSALLNLSLESHLTFRSRVIESGMIDRILYGSTEQLHCILEEFRKFFALGVPWRGDNFCPSLLIDLVWHAAMMDREFYTKLCKRFFGAGFILPHCLEHNDQTDTERFQMFEKQFQHQYGRACLKIVELAACPYDGSHVFDKLRNEANIKAEKERLAAIEAKRLWDLRAPERELERQRWEALERAHYARYGRSIGDDGKC